MIPGDGSELSEQDVDRLRSAVTAGGQLDADVVERLVARATATLASAEGAAFAVTEVLDRQLRQPRDASTWPLIEKSLITLLDDEPTALFLSWLLLDASGERVAEFETSGDSAPLRLVQRLRATFGPEIDAANTYMQLGPEDWTRVDRLIYINNENGLPGARTTITKVNGQAITFEGPATSLMALVRVLLEGILVFGSADVFDESEREQFLANLLEVHAMVTQATEGAPPSDPDALASRPGHPPRGLESQAPQARQQEVPRF